MIHLNIGSNLDSFLGDRFDNISTAVSLLIESRFKVKKISNFYETPSYPNKNFPKFINIGVLGIFDKNYKELLKIIKICTMLLANYIPFINTIYPSCKSLVFNDENSHSD